MQTRHASAKASLTGAARQGDLQLHLHRVWLCGGEEGAAVAEASPMVENLSHVVFLCTFPIAPTGITSFAVVDLLFRDNHFLNSMFGSDCPFHKPIAQCIRVAVFSWTRGKYQYSFAHMVTSN
jgi:hypothetical protein